ncbi:MAG: hypothetical protein IKM07_00240 [Clostridia bacterium]|nr:hypothetical protein [Clostridia bacterium]
MKHLRNIRIPALLTAVLLLFLTACGSSGGISDSNPPPTVTTAPSTAVPTVEVETLRLMTYRGLDPKVITALNDALDAEGLPVKVESIGHTEDGTTTSILKYYNAGLPTADLALFTDFSIMTRMHSEGFIADMAPYVDLFPGLFAEIPGEALQAAAYDGAMLGYPLLTDAFVAARESSVLLRGDILDRLGAEVPETPGELLELCILARDAGLPCDLVIDGIPPYAFHRTYPQWPFHVDMNSLVLIDREGVGAYAESDIFLQDAELYGQFHDENVLKPLYFHENRMAFSRENDALACLFPTQFSSDFEYSDELIYVQFAPEAGNMNITSPYSRFVSLSASSENPTLAMQLLELIYTQRNIYNTLCFGIENEDWVMDTQGYTEIGNVPGGPGGSLSFMTYHMNQFPPQPEDEGLRLGNILSFNPGIYNFSPDITVVNTIFTRPGFADPEGMFSIRDGSAELELLPRAVENMKAAGLGEVVEQYREQYEAFTSTAE